MPQDLESVYSLAIGTKDIKKAMRVAFTDKTDVQDILAFCKVGGERAKLFQKSSNPSLTKKLKLTMLADVCS